MNDIQILLYLIFAFGSLILGTAIYHFINPSREHRINRRVFLAEALLLGISAYIGIFVSLSLVGLYNAWCLWGVVGLSYLLLFLETPRRLLLENLFSKVNWNIWKVAWLILILFFIFRNMYFTVDVDSISSYLHSQKLWLESGSTLHFAQGDNYAVFFTQFDVVPCSLGLSVFPQETFFCQLIYTHWRLIILLLIFGYAGFRFNDIYGLAASLLFLFNDHIYYSGANQWVLINCAVVALIFDGMINFWESIKSEKATFRYALFVFFTMLIIVNKYQLAYHIIFLGILNVILIKPMWPQVKNVFVNKRHFLFIVVGLLSVLVWMLKTYLVTGNPVFPMFAGQFNSFGWSLPQQESYRIATGGMEPFLFLKYLNFFLIWPGIQATKYIAIVLFVFPLVIFGAAFRNRLDRDDCQEVGFWLFAAVLGVMAISMASHIDPRYYRYNIAVAAYAAVVGLHFLLRYGTGIRNLTITGSIILILSVPGFKVMFDQGGPFARPTYKENVQVLLNQIHTDYAVRKHYPGALVARQILEENKDKKDSIAYYATINTSLFFLPTRPILDIWRSSLIGWDVYENKDKLQQRLNELGISSVIRVDHRKKDIRLLGVDEFSDMIMKRYQENKNLTEIGTDYGLPPELRKMK